MIVIRFTESEGVINTAYIIKDKKGWVHLSDSYGNLAIRVLRHHGKVSGSSIPDIEDVYKTEDELKEAVISYLKSVGMTFELINQLTVIVTVYGEAPNALNFEAETEVERYIKRIRYYFEDQHAAIKDEARRLYPTEVSFRSREVKGDKKGAEDYILNAMREKGIDAGPDFMKTPIGRIEWKYLITHMGDPNNADTDRSEYEFVLSEYEAGA